MFTRGVSESMLELLMAMVLFCFAVSVLIFLWLVLILIAFVGGLLYIMVWGCARVRGGWLSR